MKLVRQFFSLPLILIYFLSFFFPKNRNLILVSEWGGELKKDNAYSLGKLLRSYDDFEIFFISNSIHDKAKKMFKTHSIKSYWLHLRAGVFIVGSGKKDLIPAFITPKGILINTWHGLPIKKILWLSKKSSLLISLRDFFMPFYDETPDYVISTGDFSEIMLKAFRPKCGLIKADQPRWSRLGKPTKANRCILYSPTFRDSNLEFFPLTSSQLLEIDELIEDLNLPNLIITIHPACQFKPSEIYRNILFNGRDCNKDLYSDLLPNSLCVISDLSSVLIEARFFGIKDYCYFPDKEDYIKSSRPVIHNMYEKYCGNSWNSFINILLDSKKHDLYKNNFSYKFNNPCHKVASIIKNHE